MSSYSGALRACVALACVALCAAAPVAHRKPKVGAVRPDLGFPGPVFMEQPALDLNARPVKRPDMGFPEPVGRSGVLAGTRPVKRPDMGFPEPVGRASTSLLATEEHMQDSTRPVKRPDMGFPEPVGREADSRSDAGSQETAAQLSLDLSDLEAATHDADLGLLKDQNDALLQLQLSTEGDDDSENDSVGPAMPRNKISTTNDNSIKTVQKDPEIMNIENRRERKIKRDRRNTRIKLKAWKKRLEEYKAAADKRKTASKEALKDAKAKYSDMVKRKHDSAMETAKKEEEAEDKRAAENEARRDRIQQRRIDRIKQEEENRKRFHSRMARNRMKETLERAKAEEKDAQEKHAAQKKEMDEEANKLKQEATQKQLEWKKKTDDLNAKHQEFEKKVQQREQEKNKQREAKHKAEKKAEQERKKKEELERKRQVYVMSAGFEAHGYRGGRAVIKAGGQAVVAHGARGMNAVLLTPDFRVKAQGRFDTYGRSDASQHLINFLNRAGGKDFLLLAAHDEAAARLTHAAKAAIAKFGGNSVYSLCFRCAYLLIGRKQGGAVRQHLGGRQRAVSANVALPS